MSADQPNTVSLDDLAASVLSPQVIEHIDAIHITIRDLREYSARRPRTRILFSNGQLHIDFHLVLSGKQIIMLLSAIGVSGIVVEVIRHIFGF